MQIRETIEPSFLTRYRLLIFILASTLIAYFIFAPAINILYYAGDDYRYALGGFSRECATDDGFFFMRTLGRPLQAYMDCVSYKFAFTLENMRLLRIFCIVLMGVGMGFLADFLCTLGFSIGSAFFAAGCLFLIQQLYGDTVSMGAVSLPAGILFVILANRFINTAEKYAYWNSGKNQRIQEVFFIFLSGICIFCALITYPAMGFFFSTMILAKLLFSKAADWQKTQKQVFLEVGVFGVVCFVYFVGAFINMHFNPEAPVPVQYKLDHPNFNPIEMIRRFLLLGNVFDSEGPWVIFPVSNSLHQGLIILSIVFGGALVSLMAFLRSQFFIKNKKQATINLSLLIMAVIAVYTLSSMFYLLIPVRQSMNSRLVIGTVTSGLVLILWGIFNLIRLLPTKMRTAVLASILGIFFVMEGREANMDMMIRGLGYAEKLNNMKDQIATYIAQGNKLERIHFVIPRPDYAYDKFFLSNAALMAVLGHDKYDLQWCSQPRGFESNSEQDHQADVMKCMHDLPKGTIAITYTYSGENYIKTPNTLLIDSQHKNPSFNNLF